MWSKRVWTVHREQFTGMNTMTVLVIGIYSLIKRCSIFTNALAISLRDEDRSSQNPTPVDTGIWSTAANNAFIALKNYTPAEPGDRTLVDALAPFVRTLYEMKDMKAAAQAARKGAESTRGMKPKLGRTVYVGDIGQVPDPGAIGVAELVEGLAEALR